MNRNVTVKINMKGVNKKLEKIAQEKYPPTYVTPGHSESNLSYSSPQKIYTSSGSVFVPTNEDLFYGKQKEGLPFGYRKIRCQHCENMITIPMGYSYCPECGKTVYADKNTVSLM